MHSSAHRERTDQDPKFVRGFFLFLRGLSLSVGDSIHATTGLLEYLEEPAKIISMRSLFVLPELGKNPH